MKKKKKEKKWTTFFRCNRWVLSLCYVPSAGSKGCQLGENITNLCPAQHVLQGQADWLELASSCIYDTELLYKNSTNFKNFETRVMQRVFHKSMSIWILNSQWNYKKKKRTQILQTKIFFIVFTTKAQSAHKHNRVIKTFHRNKEQA